MFRFCFSKKNCNFILKCSKNKHYTKYFQFFLFPTIIKFENNSRVIYFFSDRNSKLCIYIFFHFQRRTKNSSKRECRKSRKIVQPKNISTKPIYLQKNDQNCIRFFSIVYVIAFEFFDINQF